MLLQVLILRSSSGLKLLVISDVAAYRVFVYALFSVQGGITNKYNDIFTILTCRSVISVLM